MGTSNGTKITVQAVIQAPMEKVWSCWTEPAHIMKWNQASEDWHVPNAENDLRTGGKFLTRMEAKDGSMGFDFAGVYDEVKTHELISYTLGDGRKVEITFMEQGSETKVVETFDPESTNPAEFQQAGWQAIMDNFKAYTERS
ncbi:SRPBCC family protein [Paenibacillus urinalis]|uniref:SRPBCC family protein n=1 Tax=Paenibacillus urinalis TaxID=521520 RepID=A0AAX3MYF2_9BACL|nr:MULTISPECIES: SRPBCC family protein [Paenibacillus]WDH82625.1 SRPBCC family protein [Paenibacillus urinalis]WDH98677.1 SRPBCC family protein [Paenibacillus urinalis]WDI02371.1 SRPBCC family protein [Paenibacillus urinalis]GAK41548.1 Activator of Hsp9 ATPase 1 family protein [Paenibacillus sp. TCA20]